jgi:hypothetical protein
MSPRTASVSDKDRKSVSPRHTQNILPNASPGHQPSTSSPLVQRDKDNGQDAPAAKVARTDMPAAASHSYGGGTSDIPPKIEEGIEPD